MDRINRIAYAYARGPGFNPKSQISNPFILSILFILFEFFIVVK
jgi:hypothetical protein